MAKGRRRYHQNSGTLSPIDVLWAIQTNFGHNGRRLAQPNFEKVVKSIPRLRKPLTTYIDLVSAVERGDVYNFTGKPLPNLNVESFDFGHMFDLDDKIERPKIHNLCADKPMIYEFLEEMTVMPAGRAYLYRVSEAISIAVTHGKAVERPNRSMGTLETIEFTIFTYALGVWAAMPPTAESDIHDVIISEWLMQNRNIEYEDAQVSKFKKMNLRERQVKLMHQPKIIRLDQTVSVVARNSQSQRQLCHCVDVPSFRRVYRQPIKHGPNAGKTVIMVRAHERGRGLPPKPRNAVNMQYRVVP